MRTLFLSLAVGFLLAPVAVAAGFRGTPPRFKQERDYGGAPDCCARCGCHAPCQRKVCRVVCEMRTITKHCWRVECEEFCAPLPGCGLLCGDWRGLFGSRAEGRDADGCDDACCGKCKSCLPPKCGPVRTRKKLVRVDHECRVPVYSCEVEYLCSGCTDCADVDPGKR